MIGLLPFTQYAWQLDAALINWAGWPGYAKGIVITLLDALALAIIITHRAPKRFTPLLGWLLLYLTTAIVSIASSRMPTPSAFYAFQLMRVIVLVIAVARIAADREALRWLAFGLSAGVSFQAAVAIWQKAGGALQATGTMGHQNLLGMMTYIVMFPLLAVILGGERNKLILIGIVSSLIVIVFGASRGTVGFASLGAVVLFLLSFARHMTRHKWRILGISAVLLAIATPVAFVSLQSRFVQQRTESGEGGERRAFERAAIAIWDDHPMGVGANMYTIVANVDGYSDRAGVNWSSGRATNVHNVYLLIAAETGWPGLIAFIVLFVTSIVAGLRFAFTRRRDPAGEIALGCTVALIAVAAHGLYEWILLMYQAQYLFAIVLGVIAGLARQRRSAGPNSKANSYAVARRPLVTEPVPNSTVLSN